MTSAAVARPGLQDLPRVALSAERERDLARISEGALGSPAWRARRQRELRDLLALEVIAGMRLRVLAVDCRSELHLLVRMRVEVPTLPAGAGDLVVRPEAELALHYREAILHGPVPGTSMVEVLEPRAVFHPNVSPGPVQALCLGPTLPRAYPLREALVASYAALCMQNATLDERSHLGVMNAGASRWWTANMQRMPLSREPFLGLAPGVASREGR